MPEPMEFTIEADDKSASSALDRVRNKFTQVEKAGIETFRRISGATEAFTRGMVRVAEASGALLLARQAFREMRDSFSGVTGAADRENKVVEKTIDLYRGLRVATVALTGTRAALYATTGTIALGIGIEEAIRVTRRYGEELRRVSFEAAATGANIQDAFAINRANTILGQDLSKFAKFPVAELRAYLVELQGISDPYLQAARAQEIFGASAKEALELAERSTIKALDRGLELASSLNGEQRQAVETARRVFSGWGGTLTDIGIQLRSLREQAKQAIVVRVSAVVDFVEKGGVGRKVGGGFGEGLGGEIGFSSGFQNPNPVTIPSLAEILQGAVTREVGDKAVLPGAVRDVRGITATAAETSLAEEGRRAISAVREFESSIDGLKDKLQAARRRRDTLFAVVQQGGSSAALFGGDAVSANREVVQLEAKIEAIEKTSAAEKRAAEIVAQSKRAEFTGLAAIIAEYKEYSAELGRSAKANQLVDEAARRRIQTEARKELQNNAADVVKQNADELRNRVQFENIRFTREQEFQTATLELTQKTARQQLDFEEQITRSARESELRQIESVGNQTVQQKVKTEQRRADIEADYLLRSYKRKAAALNLELELELTNMEAIYKAQGISDEAIAARRGALVRASGEKGRQLELSIQQAIDAAREDASIRSTRVIVEAQQKAYQSLERQVEGAFDSLLARGKTAGEKLRDLLLLPLFSGIKKLAVTFTTNLLAPIVGGVGASGGGGQIGLGGGIGGGLGRIFGLGGGALGGFGGVIPGAPGGTPGFAGPVALGGGGGAGVAGIGGSLAASAASLKGILTGLGGLGRGVGTGSALAGRGVGGAAGGALLLGGITLGAIGLQRGGLSGLAMTTAAGALIGAKFGGPIGAAIGAGIGAVAGTIRLFVKGAQDKIVDKVQSVYGIKISKTFARDPLLGIIKQGFGGNIDVGIRSPQVRDLIELYAMSTGQNSAGINTSRPVASSYALSGGVLSQQAVFQNGLSSMPLGQAGGTTTTIMQLDSEATTAFLQGQAIQTIGDNPRVVQGALTQANRQNAGRREQYALMARPGLMVS